MKKIIKGKDLINMQFVETEDGSLRRYEKKGKFVPEIEQTYWFIEANGDFENYICDDDGTDEWLIGHNIVFETEEECEEYKNYLLALDKYSYDFSNEEWGNKNITKHYLFFDYNGMELGAARNRAYKAHSYYFKTMEDINAFRNAVGDEAIERYMFGYYR